MIENLCNIAIIAHVGHGETILVDKLLQQFGAFDARAKAREYMIGSSDLEERHGIAILAKDTAIKWSDYRISIADTPGYIDSSSEVERVMSMADSVLLVVGVMDGPMPQTHLVTREASAYGLKPIVIINKIDRPGTRPDWVVNQIFNLFVNLDATDEQLDSPVVYTPALSSITGLNREDMIGDMTPLHQTIIDHISVPNVGLDDPLQMQTSQLDHNNYIGVIGIDRIKHSKVKPNRRITIIGSEGKTRDGEVGEVLTHLGLERIENDIAGTGNVIAIVGLDELNISDIIRDPQNAEVLPALSVNEPTVTMSFHVNASPFCSKGDKYVTSHQIPGRPNKELMYDATLCAEEAEDAGVFRVPGRGELRLSVLIENMRRGSFKMTVSRPKIILRETDGCRQEPFESVALDIREQHQDSVMQALGECKDDLKDMNPNGRGHTRFDYVIPDCDLTGFHSEFMTMASGTGLLYSTFGHYNDVRADNAGQRRNDVLISNGQGRVATFALLSLQNRGKLFLDHGTEVYGDQIIGTHSCPNDLTVNCLTGKKLTDMCVSGTDEATILVPSVRTTPEQAPEFISDDELVEATPAFIHIRRHHLVENDRRHAMCGAGGE